MAGFRKEGHIFHERAILIQSLEKTINTLYVVIYAYKQFVFSEISNSNAYIHFVFSKY